jgi:hypothetical protein
VEEATVADRLTLVSHVPLPGGCSSKVLDEPVWLKPGQRYWYDEDESALVVEDPDGERKSYSCHWESGPDAPR